MGRGPRHCLFILVVVLATLAVYWPAKDYPFLPSFDDGVHIAGNPDLLSEQAPLGRLWSQPYLGLYVPVTYTLWRGIVLLGERHGGSYTPNPFFFHLTNLVFHCANALLVFFILQSLVGGGWAALAGALLFALHPLQVEAVAWVSALKDLGAGFFSLLAILLYINNRRVAAFPFFLLALLAKPVAAALPLLLAVLEWGWHELAPREIARRLVPWALAALPVIILTKIAQPDAHVGDVPGWPARLRVAADALVFSCAHVVFPFSLSINYGRTPAAVLAQPSGWLALAFALAGALLVLGFARLRAPVLIFVAGWLPTAGLVPFYYQRYSTVADRFLYLSLLGPALAFAGFLGRRPKQGRAIAAGGGLLFCALLSAFQLRYWRGELPLVARMTAVHPSAENHYALAARLAAIGREEEAAVEYAETVRRNPRSALAYNNLGLLLAGHRQPSAAEEKFRAALAVDPLLAAAHNNLGALLAQTGRAAEAKTHFARALELEPGLESARRNLALARHLEEK